MKYFSQECFEKWWEKFKKVGSFFTYFDFDSSSWITRLTKTSQNSAQDLYTILEWNDQL